MKTIQPASAPTPQEFGLRLYGMIERRGMTVTEFARRMGVSSAAAYFWVSGKRFPQMSLLWEIRRVLGVPWSELLGVQVDNRIR